MSAPEQITLSTCWQEAFVHSRTQPSSRPSWWGMNTSVLKIQHKWQNAAIRLLFFTIPCYFFFFSFFLLYSSFNAMYTAPFVLATGVSSHLTRDAKRVIAGIPLHVPALGLQCTWSPGSTGTRRQPLGPKGSPTAPQTPSHFERQSLRRAKAFSSLSGKAPGDQRAGKDS